MSRMRGKSVQLLLAAVAALLAVAGSAGAQVAIEFWYGETGDAYVQAMDEIVRRFNESQNDIRVNTTHKGYIGGAQEDAFLAAIAGGVPPDVAYIDGTTAMEYGITRGIVIPLNHVVPSAVLEAIPLLPVPRAAWELNGTWYGVAMRTDARGIYTNERLFEEAGLDPRGGWQDLAEFDLIAEKLTRFDASGRIQQLGFAPKGNNFGGDMAWLWVFGARVYDREINRPALTGDPKALAAMEWIQSYAQKYGADARTSDSLFRNETLAMYLSSTSLLERFPVEVPDLRWWVHEIPAPPTGQKLNFSSTRGPAIPAGAKHPQEAAKFILYLLSTEVQEYWWRQTQSIPANLEAFRNILSEIDDPRVINMLSTLPSAVTYPPFFANTVRPAFQEEAERMRRMEITPAEALENIQRRSLPIFEEVFGR